MGMANTLRSYHNFIGLMITLHTLNSPPCETLFHGADGPWGVFRAEMAKGPGFLGALGDFGV